MQPSKNTLTAVAMVLLTSSMFSACLPQPQGGTGTRRNIIQNGQNSGSNSGSNASQNAPVTPVPSSNQTAEQAVPKPPQAADCYKADAFLCKVEKLITDKTNKYRASRGLQPLTLDSKISFVARDWSQKQAQSGFISHRGFPSARASLYKTEFGQGRSMNGENVAYTSGISGSSRRDDAAAEAIADEFTTMWWNSSGHRRNMLGSFSSIGVGLAQRSNGAWYATQIFN